MKTKIFMVAVLIVFSIVNNDNVKAQWKTSGNTLVGNEKLGSLNNFPVKNSYKQRGENAHRQ